MRNVFLFLKRYLVFILFLLMQFFSLYMLFSENRFHGTVFNMFSNVWAGRINDRVNAFEAFFSLSRQNEILRNQNARLLSELPSGSLLPDTAIRFVKDTLKLDSVRSYQQYHYFSARVISNSVFLQQNYLMLHRGSEQGVSPNMAVVAPEGIIGTVVSVSRNMSTVMSLLHRQSKLIARLKKGSGLGEISWDGKDPRYLQLTKIPKTIVVAKGDTVVTSPYSDRFPPGYTVGYVYKIEEDQETNTYNLVVQTGANFYNLQHAYVVKNLLNEEMDELNKKMIKP